MAMQLLRAAPYVFRGAAQPGKVHAIREGDRTYCGNEYRYTGGDILQGDRSEVNCRSCLRSMDSQERCEEQREKWRTDREQRDREWWEHYSAYLATSAWAERRQLVLKRARGLCEGCLSTAASHVHHLTYEHVGDELLYELVALCHECHQKAHPEKDIRGGGH